MEKITANTSYNPIKDNDDNAHFLFNGIFTTMLIISVIVSALIIFPILKFKKTRQEMTNIILVHSIVMVVVYYFDIVLGTRTNVINKYNCVVYDNEHVLGLGVCSFMTLLLFDWYTKSYSKANYVKSSHFCKLFIWSIHLCVLILLITMTSLCFGRDTNGFGTIVSTNLFQFVCYDVFPLVMIVVNVIHLSLKRRLDGTKCNTGLAVANIFLICWMPYIIIELISDLGIDYVARYWRIPLILAMTSPVFTLLYLLFYVDSFRKVFKKIFKCQCSDDETDVAVVENEVVLICRMRM